MSKRLLTLTLLAVCAPAGFVACGGDDDASATASPAGARTSSPGTGAGTTVVATPTPEPPLPTPTPLDDDDPVVSIVVNGSGLAPTAEEFKAWPQTTINAGGKTYEGVTLSAMADALGASATFVEIEGVRSDGVRYAIARYALADFGASSLLVLTGTGQIDFVSSAVEPAQWLSAVTAITFV